MKEKYWILNNVSLYNNKIYTIVKINNYLADFKHILNKVKLKGL